MPKTAKLNAKTQKPNASKKTKHKSVNKKISGVAGLKPQKKPEWDVRSIAVAT